MPFSHSHLGEKRFQIILFAAASVSLMLFTVVHFRHFVPGHDIHGLGDWKGLDFGGRGGVGLKGFGKGKPREMHGNGGEICDSFFVDDLMGCAEVIGEEWEKDDMR
jgi:hypothetical protein